MRVLVIGAGVIGSAVADAVASGDADVTVIDMRSAGRGASQASAGVLAPYTEAQGHPDLLKLCARSLDLFDDFIASARERSGRAIEYQRNGTLEVALSPLEAEHLRAAKAWLDDVNVPSEWIDAQAMHAIEPAVSHAAIGALLIRAHGLVGVSSLITALVQSARGSGAVFESPVEAIDLIPVAGGVEVRAGARRYAADHAVIAAGSWSGRVRIAGMTPLPVRPVRGQLLHLTWPNGAPVSRVVWGRECYTVPWSDGTLLVGATVEDVGFDEASTVAGVQALVSGVRSLLPASRDAAMREVRVGLRPATPDGLPVIGSSAAAPNVTFATGHYRNGVLLAPITAAIVSNHILQRGTDPMTSATSPDRFRQPQSQGARP